MSFLVKPRQLDFSNNKDRENVFLSEYADDSFDFKYVSTSQIKHVMKDVKRHRTRKKEESVWASFVREENTERFDYNGDEEEEEEEEDNYNVPGVSNVKRLMRDNMEEVDQELKRLKEDALPERINRSLKSGLITDTKGMSVAENREKSSMVKHHEVNEENKNILLVIPEEIKSPSSYERSPISRLEYSTRTRKSHSERTPRPKSESGGSYHRAVKHFEYNYNSGRTRDYESDGEDTIYDPRAHPMVAHKILSIQKKVSKLLDEIGFRLNRIPIPDGDCDLRRRQQCVMEFAIRFSRNYLYELGRQISDLQRHVRAISPNARLKPSRRIISLHMQAIEQKLLPAHQLLVQALTAYCKHIPSSVLKGQPGKLKEILQIVIDLRDICTKIHLTNDYYECGDTEPSPLGKDTQNRCGAILSKLRLTSDNESKLASHTAQSTPIEGSRNKPISRNDNCKGLLSRLSMYNPNVRTNGKNIGNKKHVTMFTKEKRSSNNVKRPLHCHPTTPEQPNSSPVTCKSSRDISKRPKTKIRLPQKEDEISTMMSILPTDSDAGSSITVFGESQTSASIHKGSTTRRYSSRNPPSDHSRLLNTPTNGEVDKNDNESGRASNLITERQLSNLVPVIADLMTLVRNERKNDVDIRPVSADSVETLMELLRKYQTSKNSENPSEELPIVIDKNSLNPETNLTETRSIAKNMQLICLPLNENSRATRRIVDKSDEMDRERRNETEEATGIQSSTLKNRKVRILRVGESSLEALLKYRDEYQSWSRSNPMYTSKSQNKPWDVVAWIADKLVDELIVHVSKEFEIYNVIQKLFELEFKEF